MTRIGCCAMMAGMTFFMAGGMVSRADARADGQEFQEIYQLIREHVPGVDEAALNRAAVEGLLKSLGSKVTLVTNGFAATEVSHEAEVTTASVFPGRIGYLRIASVSPGLPSAVQDAYQKLASTNVLNGIVLDLRYAGGTDYAASAASADLFISKSVPLGNWGDGVVSSHEKTNAIQIPAAILVNNDTSGAAEALAAMLRSAGVGLIIGGRTAGEAMMMQSYPLKGGDQLRVATSPIMVGDGTKLPADGIKPDIDSRVGVRMERTYFDNPFYALPVTNLLASEDGDETTTVTDGTNAPVRFDEAELVREHQGGLDRQTRIQPHPRGTGQDHPIVTDPSLARALDFLKALAIVRESHA